LGDLAEIVKSLVFDCDGKPVVVMVPGDRRADSDKIAHAAGSRFARIAGAEVQDATGFEPGAVALFPRHASSESSSTGRCSATGWSGSAPDRTGTWRRFHRLSSSGFRGPGRWTLSRRILNIQSKGGLRHA
jgi:hypothetical protein